MEAELIQNQEKIRNKKKEIDKLFKKADRVKSEGEFEALAVQIKLLEDLVEKLETRSNELRIGIASKGDKGGEKGVDLSMSKEFKDKAVESLRARLEVESWLKPEAGEDGGSMDDFQARLNKLKS